MVAKLIHLLTRLIVGVAVLSCTSSYAQTISSKPYIQLTFDASEIYLGDAVVLELESTGLLDPINLAPLLEQATMVRETTGTRIAVIGGKVVEIKIRRMDLIPKQSGVVVIGPLMAGDITSNSVHIKVLDATRPEWQPKADDLQINTSLSPETVWVNQQVKLTIELLHRYPLNNESISLPELSDFTTRELISNRRTFKGANRDWFRTEWHYLIFPKRSGTLPLGDIHWTGTIAKSRIERAEFSRSLQSLSLPVKAAADDRGPWWLPAETLQLSEEWSMPPTELRAGDELERTIKVRATGILAGQIPSPVVPESRAVQQTLINSSRNETLTSSSVVSTAEFTYRVKAQSPIPVFLDTVRIPWWSTGDSEYKEAIIPARRINVGLPDRADVLSKLALQETGVNRFKHWLQSTNQLRFFIYVASVISVLILLFLWLPALVKWIGHRARLQQHFSALRTSARRGNEALYRQLQQPPSRALLAGAESDLVKQLEYHLFSPHLPQTNLPLLSMLDSIQRQVKADGKRRKQEKHFVQQRALAQL